MQDTAFLNPLVLYGIGVGLFLLVLLVALWWYHRRSRISGLGLKLLEIRLPRPEGREAPTRDQLFADGNKSEQLLAALSSLEQPFALELAVHHTGSEIFFYLAVPRGSMEFVSREVQGIFPDAQVTPTDDYTIFGEHSATAGAYLSLKQHFALPLRTYRESETDTFAPIVSTLSRLAEAGQGAAVQVICVPASSAREVVMKAITRLKKGEKTSDVLRTELFRANDLVAALGPGKKDEKSEGLAAPVDEEAVRALTAKISKPLYRVNVRLFAAAPSDDEAKDLVGAIAGGFSQFGAPLRNQLVAVRPRDVKKLAYQYAFREWEERQAMVLNLEEVVSIFHLPTSTVDVPRVGWVKTREAPPPHDLPESGVVIGESVFRGDRRHVRLTDDDRRRHVYIVGQTGTGKSQFMLAQIRQDMEAGRGLCVVDPHGELVADALALVPRERVDDVIVFDPGDIERPLGLNMLEYNLSRPEEKTFIVNEIQAIFNQLFRDQPEGLGPVFQQYMRNALLLLMEDAATEPATLIEVPRIFTDDAFRKRKLTRIKNPTVIDFWEKEASKTTGEQGLANIAPYVTSKFGNFIANDYMRPIIGQTKSAFNFRQVMDEGKLLFVNLSKGKIGEINSGLLGMIITGRLLLAALSREDTVNKDDRRDFYLFIDEFQTYTTNSIAVILSEARKYRLNLVLAHQFIAQLTDSIREAVFGNVGSIVAFRVGASDADLLVKQFGPEFTERDLISVENLRALVKLLIRGKPSRPFNIEAILMERGSHEVREKLKELSRLTYGADLATVEADILRRLRA